MSIDPELPQTPPPLLPPTPIKTKPTDAAATAIQSGGDSEEECKTPTAPENRIPEPLTCPPAPRKPTTAVKRKKTCDRSFFEVVNRKIVDSFFGSNFELLGLNSPRVLKKKCTYTGPEKKIS
ncbi:hypothetical protein Vadar_017754 [Vaccinium darrowii]|uniref:Uncharacterized protein n=1 Tax=Vaccinium darrowii TaxID=229202 RepID=A0ACB7XI88_9ERIC|nr:hypothetical protein Vadar_017754 [Vaccinium darrowii]